MNTGVLHHCTSVQNIALFGCLQLFSEICTTPPEYLSRPRLQSADRLKHSPLEEYILELVLLCIGNKALWVYCLPNFDSLAKQMWKCICCGTSNDELSCTMCLQPKPTTNLCPIKPIVSRLDLGSAHVRSKFYDKNGFNMKLSHYVEYLENESRFENNTCKTFFVLMKNSRTLRTVFV